MGFTNLKKNPRSLFEKLTKELEKTEQYKEDDRFWRAETDKAGNGYAVIRFLPPVDGEEIPWAKMFSHGFEINGKWYIENCPTTIGEPCPVCEKNSELWDTGIESNKDIVRKRKRGLRYISNILVLKDPAHPENEGKVFLFGYGKKIHDKIVAKIKPDYEDEKPINPFDIEEGANFKLKIKKVDGYSNYDSSSFEEGSSSLAEGDVKKIEEIGNMCHSLATFTSADKFKPYEELKAKMNKVLGTRPQESEEQVDENLDDEPVEKPTPKKPQQDISSVKKPAEKPVKLDSESSDDDVNEALNYFGSLKDE